MTKSPLRLTCAFCALLVLAIAALAATSRYTVTATINNGNCTSTINSGNCTLYSDGNGFAVYKTGPGITSTLTPDSTGAGTLYDQWNLSFGSASSRSVYLTLIPANTGSAYIFNNGTSPGPVGFRATLYSRCFTNNSASTVQNWTLISTATFPLASDTTCGMRVLFTYGGVNYTLVMSPEQAASGEPVTGAATVTCTSGSSPCTAWTDAPTPGLVDTYGNPVSNVANLYNGGSAPIGQYYLSFNIALTHP